MRLSRVLNRWRREPPRGVLHFISSPHRYAHRAGWSSLKTFLPTLLPQYVPIWQKQAPEQWAVFRAVAEYGETAQYRLAAINLFEVAPMPSAFSTRGAPYQIYPDSVSVVRYITPFRHRSSPASRDGAKMRLDGGGEFLRLEQRYRLMPFPHPGNPVCRYSLPLKYFTHHLPHSSAAIPHGFRCRPSHVRPTHRARKR